MSVNKQPAVCSQQQTLRFLEGRMPPPQLTVFERHLDTCSTCQTRILSQTAADAEWQQIADFLRDDESDVNRLSDCLPLPRLPAAGGDEESGASRMAVKQALDLLAPTDDPHMLGRIGPYEVSGLIGSGGMGVVFKGFDRSLNRFVAIKMLAPHLATIGSARQRFAREAQAAAAVVHDNVIEIYGVSEDHDPPFLVMPYVRGASLETRVTRSGPLKPAEIVRIAVQTAAGLAAAHAQGLVHRDIKPANILLPDGVERVRITDFGLARAADDASLTRSGVIAGTPQYMSPEQARGDAVDFRSDLFSLGSVMYTMCTGHAPFRAETSYGVLRRITDSTARPIREINPTVPPWLCAVVGRLHAKSPQDRYASAEQTRDLLEECLTHLQTPGHPLPLSLNAEPHSGSMKYQVVRTLAAIGLMAAAIVGAWTLLPASDPTPPVKQNRPQSQITEAGTSTPAAAESVDDAAVWNDGIDDVLQQLRSDIHRLDEATRPLPENDSMAPE